MKNDIFNSVKGLRPRKNAFNLSHGNSFTTDMGLVVPVFVRDCVPNSDFRIDTHALGRFMALISPIMDNIDLYVHYWKVPYRILDPNFPKFISGDIADQDYDPPYFTIDAINAEFADLGYELGSGQSILPFTCPGSLFDFLGLPIGNGSVVAASGKKFSIRPFLAYASLIEYEYRVENISIPLSDTLSAGTGFSTFGELLDDFLSNCLGDSSSQLAQFIMALAELPGNPAGEIASETYWQNPDFWKFGFWHHAWRRDYFTSAFPWVQRGEPVTLPIGGNIPVTIPAGQEFWLDGPKSGATRFGVLAQGSHEIAVGSDFGGEFIVGPTAPTAEHNAIAETFVKFNTSDTEHETQMLRSLQGLNALPLEGSADLEEATSITINELRILNALQVYKERSLRFGGRYKEYLQGFWNQKSLDARLDYPEWLGGGKLLFNVSDIAQTSQTDDTPQGNLAGKGTAFGTGFAGFKHTHIYEESMIIGLMYIAPKPAYCQGVSRFLTKLTDRFDFYNPSFDHIGEQEIHGYEIYAAKGDKAAFDSIFGYQVRYAEYRTMPSEVHGDLKDSLSYWKLTRIFSDRPFLNAEFVYIQPASLMRIFATTQTAGHVLVDMWFDVKALQPMSKYGTPMLMA